MDKLLAEILKKITPSPEEHERELGMVDLFIKKLGKKDIKPVLVGSLAKKTDLRGDKDIDIFIMFSPDASRERLEKEGLQLGKEVFRRLKVKYEIDYAEHPYVMGKYKNYDVEIVPCYSGGKMLSSVDRTPLHTHYIKRKLLGGKKLRDDIRLLKQFMKGINVYGAEAKVQGFSGYLVELLVLHYGSFINVLKETAKWHFGDIVIDHEGLWEDPKVLKHFFTNAQMVVVDPVDKDRNVAAAVSKQKLAEFIIAAAEFLKKPSVEYFFPKERKAKSEKELLKSIKDRGTMLIAFVFKHGKVNPNSLYDQIRTTENALKQEIHEYEFSIFRSGFWTNERDTSVVLLEFDVWNLPRIKHHLGPPIDVDALNQERFLEKYKKDRPYIKDSRWVVNTERQYKTVEQLTPRLLEERRGFGKELRTAKVKVLQNKDLLKLKEKSYRRHLDVFL
ncbi:MAG: CCA tRNA nucleotidyltransferase [Candidatus Altiarchaeota archaeon]